MLDYSRQFHKIKDNGKKKHTFVGRFTALQYDPLDWGSTKQRTNFEYRIHHYTSLQQTNCHMVNQSFLYMHGGVIDHVNKFARTEIKSMCDI